MAAVDFNKIFDIEDAREKNGRFQPVNSKNDIEVLEAVKKPPEASRRPYTRLQQEADRRSKEREQYQQVYSKYQNNIRKSGTLRAEIMQGIKTGEDLAGLLLKAIECIALQTDDRTLYEQAEKDVISIYGYGLGETVPLHIEKQKTEERLQRIEAALSLEEDNDRRRILTEAVRQHKRKIEQIEKSLHS